MDPNPTLAETQRVVVAAIREAVDREPCDIGGPIAKAMRAVAAQARHSEQVGALAARPADVNPHVRTAHFTIRHTDAELAAERARLTAAEQKLAHMRARLLGRKVAYRALRSVPSLKHVLAAIDRDLELINS